MKKTRKGSTFAVAVAAVLIPFTLGGCSGLMLHPIYYSSLFGGLVGGIIGYQSGEAAAGALIGAAVTGTGELLKQTDQMKREQGHEQAGRDCDEEPCDCDDQSEHKETDCDSQATQAPQEKAVVEITSSDGTVERVELVKQGNVYVGPNGQVYKELP